ncbi:MAG: hypothetical protein R3B40_24400 [Polyangiales bacterium]|nr:hypothetical protein [Myxococcales bacterium]MCB9659524.1 hypothetical protein [Sandaracinaceae bacterium]
MVMKPGGARRASLLLLPLLLAAVVGSALGSSQPVSAEVPESPDCLTVRGEARMQAYGYAHVVVVQNACRRVAHCEVWTSADPTPRHRLVVRAGETGSVTTRIGSPAREVVPGHQCELR